MRILLLPISFLYYIVLSIRHKLYDWHFFRVTRFEKPVICVGNLNLGGTGKTPHTEYLINFLKDTYHVATLSRGYGRKTKGLLLANSTSTCDDIGDEPLQYFRKFPDILVAVNEDRVDGVRKLLLTPYNAEVVLLDDAFQHRSLKAGLNILLTEYGHLYEDDFLFPAGTLRDVRSAAKRAHIIVVTKVPKTLGEEEKKQLSRRLKPLEHQKVFFSTMEYTHLTALNTKAESYEAETADAIVAFCGIAHPEPFAEELKKRYETVDFLTFADHHPYTEEDLRSIMRRFENLGSKKKIIVTTEKDAARLTNSPYLCLFESAPLYALPVKVRLLEEEKFNNEIIEYVRQNHHHC